MAKNNKDFYATRSTAWWKVAIAMIGSCLSGVTFVSVPGMVGVSGFGYLQMVLGFFLGYLVIAFVLTPLYFRLNVVSVYEYLDKRFGISSHKTGAWFSSFPRFWAHRPACTWCAPRCSSCCWAPWASPSG